jgi:hypothetical protein
MTEAKSFGAAIDEIIAALSAIPESSRLTAIRAACEHLGVDFGGTAEFASSNPPIGSSLPSVPPADTGSIPLTAVTDIRSLKERKNPANATEMAAVLAYYLQHLAPESERKSHITAADVNKYFIQAGFPLQKRSDQMLVNARAAGYFDSATRGAYTLNPVGHNLVTHSLPRAAGSSSKSSARRPTSKSGAKRSKPRAKR